MIRQGLGLLFSSKVSMFTHRLAAIGVLVCLSGICGMSSRALALGDNAFNKTCPVTQASFHLVESTDGVVKAACFSAETIASGIKSAAGGRKGETYHMPQFCLYRSDVTGYKWYRDNNEPLRHEFIKIDTQFDEPLVLSGAMQFFANFLGDLAGYKGAKGDFCRLLASPNWEFITQYNDERKVVAAQTSTEWFAREHRYGKEELRLIFWFTQTLKELIELTTISNTEQRGEIIVNVAAEREPDKQPVVFPLFATKADIITAIESAKFTASSLVSIDNLVLQKAQIKSFLNNFSAKHNTAQTKPPVPEPAVSRTSLTINLDQQEYQQTVEAFTLGVERYLNNFVSQFGHPCHFQRSEACKQLISRVANGLSGQYQQFVSEQLGILKNDENLARYNMGGVQAKVDDIFSPEQVNGFLARNNVQELLQSVVKRNDKHDLASVLTANLNSSLREDLEQFKREMVPLLVRSIEESSKANRELAKGNLTQEISAPERSTFAQFEKQLGFMVFAALLVILLVMAAFKIMQLRAKVKKHESNNNRFNSNTRPNNPAPWDTQNITPGFAGYQKQLTTTLSTEITNLKEALLTEQRALHATLAQQQKTPPDWSQELLAALNKLLHKPLHEPLNTPQQKAAEAKVAVPLVDVIVREPVNHSEKPRKRVVVPGKVIGNGVGISRSNFLVADYLDSIVDEKARFFVALAVELVLLVEQAQEKGVGLLPGVSRATEKLQRSTAFTIYQKYQGKRQVSAFEAYQKQDWRDEFESLCVRAALQQSAFYRILGWALCQPIWPPATVQQVQEQLKRLLNIEVVIPQPGHAHNESIHTVVGANSDRGGKEIISHVISAGFFYNHPNGMQELKFKALVEIAAEPEHKE